MSTFLQIVAGFIIGTGCGFFLAGFLRMLNEEQPSRVIARGVTFTEPACRCHTPMLVDMFGDDETIPLAVRVPLQDCLPNDPEFSEALHDLLTKGEHYFDGGNVPSFLLKRHRHSDDRTTDSTPSTPS